MQTAAAAIAWAASTGAASAVSLESAGDDPRGTLVVAGDAGAFLPVETAAFDASEPQAGTRVPFDAPAAARAVAPAPATGDRESIDPELARQWFQGIGLRAAAPRPPPPREDDAPQLAQFQLPPKQPAPPPGSPDAPAAAPGGGAAPTVGDPLGSRPRTLTQQLTYQYGYGSESQISYLSNPDLNKRVSDNLMLVAPQVNGIFIYRPTNWLEATVEMVAAVEIPSHQPEVITLPNGQVVFDQPSRSELLVDQGFVTLKRVIAPFEASVGRRNYEDERHWLYDGSLDVGALTFRQGALRVDAFAGREVYKNLNLIPGQFQVKDRINTANIYVDYRGIEDLRLAAYQISRHDLNRNLGYPRVTGVRAIGRPSDELNYWAELAYAGGRDPLYNKYSGRGLDIGATYRFLALPLRPNVTLSYAYGSGESNPGGATNHTFHQSGLQSNEQRWAGVAKFKYYGEVLDPELSNLKIITVGLGFWPTVNATVDLVYHKYKLDKLADEVAGSPITGLMAQVDSHLSRAVGQELDVVIGLRNLFGLRRLGVDLRMGWFFPGKAFIRNDGTDEQPILRNADKAFAFIAKFWW